MVVEGVNSNELFPPWKTFVLIWVVAITEMAACSLDAVMYCIQLSHKLLHVGYIYENLSTQVASHPAVTS